MGPVLSSIPLSMPVSTTFESAFGNRLRSIKETGVYNKFWDDAQEKTQPKSACPVGNSVEDDVDEGADISSMIGTLAISLVLQVIALVLAAIEHHKKVPIQKISGGGSDSLRRKRRNPICAGTPAGRTAALLAHAKLAP